MKAKDYLPKHIELLIAAMKVKGSFFYIREGIQYTSGEKKPDRLEVGLGGSQGTKQALDAEKVIWAMENLQPLHTAQFYSYQKDYIILLEREPDEYISHFLRSSGSLFGKINISTLLEAAETVSPEFFLRILSEGNKTLPLFKSHMLEKLFSFVKKIPNSEAALVKFLERNENHLLAKSDDLVAMRDALFHHFDDLSAFSYLPGMQQALNPTTEYVFLHYGQGRTLYLPIDFQEISQVFAVEGASIKTFLSAFESFLPIIQKEYEHDIMHYRFHPEHYSKYEYSFSELFVITREGSEFNEEKLEKLILSFCQACEQMNLNLGHGNMTEFSDNLTKTLQKIKLEEQMPVNANQPKRAKI